RMRPLTYTTPKPLIKLGNKSLLEHLVLILPKKITELILVVGHLGEKIRALPYIFHDPIQFAKKMDPRKLRFASRIDGKEQLHSHVHSIKSIESPECVELSSGLRIRLLGVKAIPSKINEAVNFLRNITRNQKVFVKFDKLRYDGENTALGYLFLRNKTFINAHLIKRGLAEVDRLSEYRWKRKFLQYTNLNDTARGLRQS
ncbi:MAG: thermonuclease family protein, partial [Bacteroidota bacterium]